MPRTRRLIPTEAALHIMTRGNNKQFIFNNNDDKQRYYYLLKKLKEENNITIFNYCFMNNHSHLIVWLNDNSRISRFMKQLNLAYFSYYKNKYGYSGHLWQGRFKSNIIDTDCYLLQCGKYIELNPVRAGIVNFPEQYKFSSYRCYAKAESDPIVSFNPAYLGLSDYPEKRRKQYIEFVLDGSILNKSILENQLFVGSDKFIKRFEECYGIRNTRQKLGRPRKEEK